MFPEQKMMMRYSGVGRLFGLITVACSLALTPVLQATADDSATTSAARPADSNEGSRARSPVWALNDDVAGKLQVVTARYEDTFAEIGHQRSLGYLELVKANPGVDPWLPGEGSRITLPRQYVLPDSSREGIVINLAEYRLYYFRDGGVQVFPVGIGREENPSPITDARVTMGLESPAWYPPASIRASYEASGEYLPRMIPPGPDNPLGSHALLLSAESYLIHGTNKKFGIGMQVSAGCFRMYNEDISRFVYEVEKGTPVQIIRQPVKIGMSGGQVWLEVHRAGEDYPEDERDRLWTEVSNVLRNYTESVENLEIQRGAVELAVDQADGIPRMIGERVAQLAASEAPADDRSEAQQGERREQPTPQLWF